jgi:CBS domain-containing protein
MDLDRSIKKFVEKDPIIVNPEEGLRSVAEKMSSRNRDVAVVMTEEGEVTGLVTAGDLFYALRTEVLGKDMHEETPIDAREERVYDIIKRVQASDFMQACGLTGTQACISISEDETIANAIRVMSMSGIDHILVIGEKGVVGTLSDNNLVRAFFD